MRPTMGWVKQVDPFTIRPSLLARLGVTRGPAQHNLAARPIASGPNLDSSLRWVEPSSKESRASGLALDFIALALDSQSNLCETASQPDTTASDAYTFIEFNTQGDDGDDEFGGYPELRKLSQAPRSSAWPLPPKSLSRSDRPAFDVSLGPSSWASPSSTPRRRRECWRIDPEFASSSQAPAHPPGLRRRKVTLSLSHRPASDVSPTPSSLGKARATPDVDPLMAEVEAGGSKVECSRSYTKFSQAFAAASRRKDGAWPLRPQDT
ncbi:uncharacterized protein A4U43_C05F5810 [Asparagus officinalis]|uniref:Uncharacterized protein n=1 Tax=Asparagus officinalis TaxID=4686 RepID=A0A5P1EQ92_ASPOF|nr:uncharacterized protein A4U43_C05F5810 [Asparagus officinalis]